MFDLSQVFDRYTVFFCVKLKKRTLVIKYEQKMILEEYK